MEPAGVNKCTKEYSSILPTSFVPSKKDCPETPEESSTMQQEFNVEYASCVGYLIYIFNTHPYMTYGINKLAKFSRNPDQVHMLALIHLLRYLCQHTQFGLTYYSNEEESPVHKMLKSNNINPTRRMFTFSDSSWDDDHDTSRSTGGYQQKTYWST